MFEIIFIFTLIASLAGMAVILYRRMPDLIKVKEPSGDLRVAAVLRIKEAVRRIPMVSDFSYELYLQKILSRIRILTLKTDSKTSGWLERLRQKQSQENGNGNDKYWEELKKAKDGK